MATLNKLHRQVFNVEVKDAFNAVIEAVMALNEVWPQAVDYAVVYRLPIYDEQQVPEAIEPQVIEGEAAIEAACEALGQFHWTPEQHVATVMRQPGVVVLRTPLKAYFDRLNAAKLRLHTLFREQYSKGYRRVVAQRLFPGVSMLQVYRQVKALDQCPQRILFSWAGHTTMAYKLSRPQVVGLIEAQRERCPPGQDHEHWQTMVDLQLKKVDRIPPKAQYRQRRLIAPHPRVMIYMPKRKASGRPPVAPREARATRHDAMWHASLPVFVFRTGKTPSPRIDHLKPWYRDQRQRPRRDQLRREPLVEGLDLFVVYPGQFQ